MGEPISTGASAVGGRGLGVGAGVCPKGADQPFQLLPLFRGKAEEMPAPLLCQPLPSVVDHEFLQ